MSLLFKSWVNGILAQFKLKIYSINAHGREDIQDIKKFSEEVLTIIDAGANIGQSVLKFRAAFPSADIYSFEPVQKVFAKLLINTKGLDRVHLFPKALGSSVGTASIHIRAHDTTHTLVAVDDALGVEIVNVDTVDHFCETHGLANIDLLKIDVEGFDLEVLKGAENRLKEGKVRFVLVECCFTPGDSRHILFDSIRDYLHSFGYRTFGIYDQQPEWTGEPSLRFANVCFCLQ